MGGSAGGGDQGGDAGASTGFEEMAFVTGGEIGDVFVGVGAVRGIDEIGVALFVALVEVGDDIEAEHGAEADGGAEGVVFSGFEETEGLEIVERLRVEKGAEFFDAGGASEEEAGEGLGGVEAGDEAAVDVGGHESRFVMHLLIDGFAGVAGGAECFADAGEDFRGWELDGDHWDGDWWRTWQPSR